MNKHIYLDNNATTGIDPRVVQVLQAELHEIPQNPSSVHFFGQQARGKLNAARREIAAFFGVQPQEVIFTSSATEGLNLILRGLFEKHSKEGHVITSCVEHSAIYRTLQILQQKGLDVTFLQTGLQGTVTAESVAAAIRPDTKLIVLMGVNNETGVRSPVEEIAAIAQQTGVPFVVDGVAWLGKEVFSIPAGVSAICFSGHKIHAPKGVGLMIVRQNFTFPALITGGGQEYNRRSGTENMLGIVGLAEAIRVLQEGQEKFVSHMQELRLHFEQQLLSKIGEITIHGEGMRVCNTTSIAFHGVDAESLLIALDQIGIAASHGSACSSGALEPSRILLNMGLSRAVAKSSMRFSLSRFTTRDEIDTTLDALQHLAVRLR